MPAPSYPSFAVPAALAALSLIASGCSERATPTLASASASSPVAASIARHEGAPSSSVSASPQAPSASVLVPAKAPSSPAPTPLLAALDGGTGAPCPEGTALVDRTCVDLCEAHLLAPGEDGALAPWPHNKRPPEGVRYVAESKEGMFPQGYVSRVEAALACQNAGKRLCSRREWQRACQGRRHTMFPYGQKRVAGRCNNEKPHLLSQRFGPNPRRWKYEQFNDPTLDTEPGFLAKSGDYSSCDTTDGVHDMIGNLHEWVSDTVDEAFLERFDAEDVERVSQPRKIGNGMFMGGFFSTADQHGPGCSFTTVAHEPTYHDYSIGFRCCKAADLPKKKKKK